MLLSFSVSFCFKYFYLAKMYLVFSNFRTYILFQLVAKATFNFHFHLIFMFKCILSFMSINDTNLV